LENDPCEKLFFVCNSNKKWINNQTSRILRRDESKMPELQRKSVASIILLDHNVNDCFDKVMWNEEREKVHDSLFFLWNRHLLRVHQP
jgi:hypothetical protein